jgi:hypothetical protein
MPDNDYSVLIAAGATNFNIEMLRFAGEGDGKRVGLVRAPWPLKKFGKTARQEFVVESFRQSMKRAGVSGRPRNMVVTCAGVNVPGTAKMQHDKFPDDVFDFDQPLRSIGYGCSTLAFNDALAEAVAAGFIKRWQAKVIQRGLRGAANGRSASMRPGTGFGAAACARLLEALILWSTELGNICPGDFNFKLKAAREFYSAAIRILLKEGMKAAGDFEDVRAEGLHKGPCKEARFEQLTGGIGFILLGWIVLGQWLSPQEVTARMIGNGAEAKHLRNIWSAVLGAHARTASLAFPHADLYLGGRVSSDPYVFDETVFLAEWNNAPQSQHRGSAKITSIAVGTPSFDGGLPLRGVAQVAEALRKGQRVQIY